MANSSLCFKTAIELVTLLHNREVSAVEVLDAHLAQIERVNPQVNAIVLTPIAPHTLTNRPVVLPETSAIRIQPELGDRHAEAFASFDGQSGIKLERGDAVTVDSASRPLRMIRAASRPYFAVLREKLRWTER